MKLYNANEVTCSVSGIPIHKTAGYADGEFIRIEYEADGVVDVVGTDGEVTASLSNDERALVTLILMKSSDSNDLLSALYAKQVATKMRTGVGALLIKDNSGRSLHQATSCWIRKLPNVAYGREVASVEWAIRCAKLKSTLAGNITVGG